MPLDSIDDTAIHGRAQALPAEALMPGFPRHCMFMNDPAGAWVEQTFAYPKKALIDG